MDRSVIERYIAGAELLGPAIRGLTPAERNATPVAGTWSIQQIVFHLLDSDLIAADRMKRVIAEERPTLIGFNETLFAEKLYCEQLDADAACAVFAGNRRLMGEILRRLPDDAFARVGIHNERGELTLAQLVQIFADHLEHHLKFIKQKRALLGKAVE